MTKRAQGHFPLSRASRINESSCIYGQEQWRVGHIHLFEGPKTLPHKIISFKTFQNRSKYKSPLNLFFHPQPKLITIQTPCELILALMLDSANE